MRVIVGIMGVSGAGKDTIGDYLQNKYGFIKTSCATPLKKIISILTGWTYDFVNGTDPVQRPLRETLVHPIYGKTCRELMQFIGTDLFRNQLHPDTWTYALQREIESCSDNNIVVTDLRFENEIRLIQNIGGYIIKIERPSAQGTMTQETKVHVSEKDMNVAGQHLIINDQSLEDLYDKIDQLSFLK